MYAREFFVRSPKQKSNKEASPHDRPLGSIRTPHPSSPLSWMFTMIRSSVKHALQRQCLPPCDGGCVGSVGNSVKGFHSLHVEQNFPGTPFLTRTAIYP